MTTLAAVVCAYTEERWDDIVEAVASLRRQQPPLDEIVLVVDHNDVLLDRARTTFTEGVLIVANEERRGLSGARNTGINHSTADIVAFLDDDAAADDGWSSALHAVFDDATVVGAGGYVAPHWRAPRPGWWPTEFDWVVGCSYTGLPTQPSDIRNPIGANMAVRRSAFERVGGFSPAIGRVGKHPVGCEETELFIRIAQHSPGSRVRFVPTASVRHHVPAARANFGYFLRRCFAEGLSKAVVAKLVGSGDALSSERSYSTRTLPAGVVRGVGSTLRGDRSGVGRAAAIVAGLAVTTLGYARGRIDRGSELRLPDPKQSS